MVIMKMSKEFTSGEAFIAQPHEMLFGFYADVIGQAFNDSQ
jgi:hypothetical protein